MVATDEFDYDLPDAAIAQTPVEPRTAARLLVDRGPGTSPDHRQIEALVDLVGPGDLLVVNNSRVIPARLHVHRATGGRVELLFLEPAVDDLPTGIPEGPWWTALARPARKLKPGDRLSGDPSTHAELIVEIGGRLDDGMVLARPVGPDGGPLADVVASLVSHGQVPLPPYIRETLADPERYQTVYADRPGSVAAPTAGLHLTDELLDRCRAKGATVATVELIVGLGTFRPIVTERIEDHQMHTERYSVPEATIEAVANAERVTAIGTTAVRALESWAGSGESTGRTDLFINRGFEFRVVDRLWTNFHTPKSSLLVLIDAFVGPRWRDLYGEALAAGYRFLSFGDAMILERTRQPERARP